MVLRVFPTVDKIRSFIPNRGSYRPQNIRESATAFINGQPRFTPKKDNENFVLTSRVSEAFSDQPLNVSIESDKLKNVRSKFILHDGSENATLSSEGSVFSRGVTKGLNRSQELSEDVETEAAIDKMLSINATEMTLITDLYEHLVSVTAISDNHFIEAQDMFRTVQHCFPNKKIIVYDLGLNAKNRHEVSSYTNVEIRSFPFDEYSHLPHVKNLHTYAWKPIIIKLVSQEYDIIMYGDASLRMKTCDINPALEHLLKFPYINANTTSHSAIEFTHDGMIKYLHYPKKRKDMADIQTLQACGWLLWANDLMKEKLIDPWLDCALHKECIAPSGAKLWPCQFTKRHDGHYVGCHRYDQSAMNLIMAREFGMEYFWRSSNKTLSNKIWAIKRL